MAIPYKIVAQCEPGVKGGGKQTYALRAWKRQKVDFKELCDKIAERSTLSRADTVAAVTALADLVPELLLNGKSVQVGDLGIFSLSLKSKKETEYKNVTARSVIGAQINFRPSKELKQKVKRPEVTRKLK